MQEAQGGQKELSAQVLFPSWLWALALGGSLLLEFGVIAQVHKGDLPLFPFGIIFLNSFSGWFIVSIETQWTFTC